MKNKKKSSAWTAGPTPRGSSGMIVTPRSGGENTQLKGYDATNRVAAKANGGTRTADILSRPGKHVPTDKGWHETPADHFEVNRGPQFRSGPEIKAKSWRLKK